MTTALTIDAFDSHYHLEVSVAQPNVPTPEVKCMRAAETCICEAD